MFAQWERRATAASFIESGTLIVSQTQSVKWIGDWTVGRTASTLGVDFTPSITIGNLHLWLQIRDHLSLGHRTIDVRQRLWLVPRTIAARAIRDYLPEAESSDQKLLTWSNSGELI